MSANSKIPSSRQWSSTQAYAFAVVCLVVGVASGWVIRSPHAASRQAASINATTASVPAASQSQSTSQSTPGQLTGTADTQAAPLLEQLKSDPKNPDLLAKIGNTYYDAQQFLAAIEYYQRSLQVRPADVSVRTDLGTAYWYTGDPDTGIQQLDQTLTYDPNNANALFNLGVVKWQGKQDGKGALAAWHKLLEADPNYENKDKVLAFIAEVQKQSSDKP